MGQIIGIHTQTGVVTAYTADPLQADRAGGVLLLHDVWGLDDNTKNIADRLARQGYHVVAPNLLAGTEMEKRLRPELREGLHDPSRRVRSEAEMLLQRALLPLKTPQIASLAIIRAHASFEFLFNQPKVRNRVSMMGFGFGGTHTLSLTIRESRISAAVAFYPQANYVAYELRHIACPLMIFTGERDQPAMSSLIRMRSLMQHTGADFTPTLYEGVGPFFFDESIPGSFDPTAATDSWARSMSFFQRNMS